MDAANKLQLLAPLSGSILRLERVPDRTFARKSVGEGVAIEPSSSTLLAPCAGKIAFIHPAGHALTLHTEQGVELLLHIGLGTVSLNGQGFTPLVNLGQSVEVTTPLLEFDPKLIKASGCPLTSLVVVTNGELIAQSVPCEGDVEAGLSPLLSLTLRASASSTEQSSSSQIQTDPLTIQNRQGLHARPAACLAKLCKKYQAQIELEHNGKWLDGKSLLAIMTANIQYQDRVRLRASGQDANYAIEAITQAINQGVGHQCHFDEPSPPPIEEAPILSSPRSDEQQLRGVSTLPRIGLGQAYQWQASELAFPQVEYGNDIQLEKGRLAHALCEVQRQLAEQIKQLKLEGNEQAAGIFTAHSELLEDPTLLRLSRYQMALGTTAEYAWYDATQAQLKKLKATENPLLIERAQDLKSLRQKVLNQLLGRSEPKDELNENTIVVAQSLSPAEVSHLAAHNVAGIVLTQGSATSHAILMARSLGIPTLCAVPQQALTIEDGTPLILDGIRGVLHRNTSEQLRTKLTQEQQQLRHDEQQALSETKERAVSRDGQQIEVVANIANMTDAIQALQWGAEGVGLVRSEFLYLDQYAEPTEEEQAQVYLELAQLLGADKQLTIRTLDAGGEKRLHYLHLAREANPALGERGIRVGLQRPSMLRRQVRAILRASRHAKIRIMFPMVATLAELRAAKQLVHEEASKLFVTDYQVGIMVEVPSVALLAAHFAQEADFFSIGTNDLTQYTLAMDRENPALSWQVDVLDPAVLKLIQMTVSGARQYDRPVAVCGAASSDPLAIPLLLGLGVEELSASVARIPQVKQQIRSLSLSECQELAKQALEQPDSQSVRALIRKTYEQMDLRVPS